MREDSENRGEVMGRKSEDGRTRGVGETGEAGGREGKIINFEEAAERVRKKRELREMGRKVLEVGGANGEANEDEAEEGSRKGEAAPRKELTVAERLGKMVKRAGLRRENQGGRRERRSIEALGIERKPREESGRSESLRSTETEGIDFRRIQEGLEKRADEFKKEWEDFEAIKADMPEIERQKDETFKANRPEMERRGDETFKVKANVPRVNGGKDPAARRAEWARRRQEEKAREKAKAKIERSRRAKRILKELAMDGLIAVAALGIFAGVAVKNANAGTDKFAGKKAPKKIEKEATEMPSNKVEGMTENDDGELTVNLEKFSSNLKLNQEKQAQRQKEQTEAGKKTSTTETSTAPKVDLGKTAEKKGETEKKEIEKKDAEWGSALEEAEKADIGDYAKWSDYWDERSREFFGDDVQTTGAHIDYGNGIYEID